MNDITIVCYTSNQRDDTKLTNATREHLLKHANGARIISVSQKPINFGYNICVGDIGISNYNLYYQVYTGAREVRTKYMMCAEDDYFYSKSHFNFRPLSEDTIYYDTNRWSIDRNKFFWRERTILGMCIAPTLIMVNTLGERFDRFKSDDYKVKYFSEPGKYEGHLEITPVKAERVMIEEPSITFNHRPSLGGIRKVRSTDTIVQDLLPWGNAEKIWQENIH